MRRMTRVRSPTHTSDGTRSSRRKELSETVSNVPRFRSEEEPERHRGQEQMDIVARFVLERLEKGDPDASFPRRR